MDAQYLTDQGWKTTKDAIETGVPGLIIIPKSYLDDLDPLTVYSITHIKCGKSIGHPVTTTAIAKRIAYRLNKLIDWELSEPHLVRLYKFKKPEIGRAIVEILELENNEAKETLL